jgi:hypothetical protein
LFGEHDDIGDIGHIDSPFQLQSRWPTFGIRRWLVFAADEFGLLLIGVEVLAAEQNPLEEIDMILKRVSDERTRDVQAVSKRISFMDVWVVEDGGKDGKGEYS